MRVETLPSPGLLSNGIRIRIEAAKAISAVEIAAAYSGGKSSTASSLSAFFTACASALSTFIDVILPTYVSSAIVPTRLKEIIVTFSEGLKPDINSIPVTTAFTIGGQGAATVTKVAIVGNTVVLTTSINLVAGATTIAYTKPVSGPVLEDTTGNDVATFTAQSVTNGIV